MKKRQFGELEAQILYLMRTGERKTVKEIHHALGQEDSYTTIMTVMTRLFHKKQLCREKVGHHFEYWLQNLDTSSLLKKWKQRFFGIKTSVLVAHLIESAEDLSLQDLEYMAEMVQKAKDLKK